MVEFFKTHLLDFGLDGEWSGYLSNALAAIAVILISVAVYVMVQKLLLKLLITFISRIKSRWDDFFIKNKVFDRLIRIIPASVIYAFAPQFPGAQVWIQRIAFSYILFVIVLSLNKLLDTVNDIYSNYEVSKSRPIKGYLQVVKIIAYVVGGIAVVGVLIDRSPWLLLGGIGAASAVLLLIFQNSILGLVAGIQLSANNMVRLGDWIEMSKYGADGDVIEITLHTVKVQNWDKTITTIPTYSLISESFKNWRGMQEAGGRRIKRSVYIDMTSIRFCTDEMLERFKKIEYIREYLNKKEKELESFNNRVNPASAVNGRHLTNIGTFRAYVEQYLRNNPNVHHGMTKLVRQLEPSEKGLPIEIYAFTSDTAWENYEAIQADIFDHILSVIPEFDLQIYQSPTGHDFKCLYDEMNAR